MFARVMIKCPITEKPVDTGYGMDDTFFEAMPLADNSIRCPACGQTHVWSKKDAWLSERHVSNGA